MTSEGQIVSAKSGANVPQAKSLTFRLLVVALAVTAAVVILNLTGALDYLSFAALARNREWLVGRVEALGFGAAVVFIVFYTVSTALSLPTGLLLSTLGGFLFGTWWGGFYILVGATLGSTIIFVAAKTVLGDLLRARAGPFLKRLEAGFRENELSYMFVLRLVPLFPFWLVNLAPAFLGVRLSTFIVGTFLGIIPGVFVFASVGTGLSAILESGDTPDGTALLQPRVLFPILGLAALALIPVAYKHLRRLSHRGATQESPDERREPARLSPLNSDGKGQ